MEKPKKPKRNKKNEKKKTPKNTSPKFENCGSLRFFFGLQPLVQHFLTYDVSSMTVWSYIVQINNANDNNTNNQDNADLSLISSYTDTTSFVSLPSSSNYQQYHVCSGIPNDGGLVLNLLADVIVAGVGILEGFLYFIL